MFIFAQLSFGKYMYGNVWIVYYFQTDLDQARTLKDRIITAFKVSIFRPPVNLDNFQSQPEEGNHISSLSVN